ncbi:ribosome hibernation-promoting factor, HPF/YfiA family [Estrella lausannensis]|uniref:Ribosome hibernation promoting factor n=1 Tax=Estrella lausannensis TaxID=483423 RepID=A0A0H5E3I4_9BACT|nr:ribosome-associated translation inhibitor RaiA [Estrella lausannensis]CRX37775.1 conserved hypothetical protein [Estrella lausannensis]
MSRKTKAEQFQDTGYNITVTGRHVLVTDAMKDYAQEKIFKIEKFTNRIIDVNIRMDIQKLEHRVDIVMTVGHLKIKSSASTTDMYVSIDQAADKLEKQLIKYKKRLQEHAAKDVASIEMQVSIIKNEDSQIREINDEIESENNRALLDSYGPHRIVDKETRPLKTLTTSEAVMKMDLSGDAFLIYRSEEEQKLKVIYRRKDGTLGIIEVES